MRVTVVGGGSIGLACAWYLIRAGAEVVVVERHRVGDGASYGNAGWITPAFSAPLPTPGLTRQILRWSFDRDRPLRIHPRVDPAFALWCWRFWRNCRREKYLEGMRALLALNNRTLDLFDDLEGDGVEFEMHKSGLMFLFRSEDALTKEHETLDELRKLGYPGESTRLSTVEARRIEPAIHPDLEGAIRVPDERHLRPETLISGLAAALRREGVTIHERTDVTAICLRRDGWRLESHDRVFESDRVVVASGAWSSRLLEPLGVSLDQEAAKGYSLTTVGAGMSPTMPLYFAEAKVACSPFMTGTRVAGFFELGGWDTTVPQGRMTALMRSISTYIDGWEPVRPTVAWAGLRPVTADGLPLIGAVPGKSGLFVATGHAMLGITLAPATGAALAPLVLTGQIPSVLRPFRLDR